MKNNINIDGDKLLSDLFSMRSVFSQATSFDAISVDYATFSDLNKTCAIITDYMCSESKMFCDPKRTQKMLDRRRYKAINFFINFINENQETRIDLFSNFTHILDDLDFQWIPFFDFNRRYNEKDFIDLILSYYSTYGDKYYNIVKKYFDENRVQMGLYDLQMDFFEKVFKLCKTDEQRKNVVENYYPDLLHDGFFGSLTNLSSAYIMSDYNSLTSLSATALVHEFGHAIDAELFLFPQKKKIDNFSDLFVEIPASTFELCFLDYLEKNKIDEDYSVVNFNNKCIEIDNKTEEIFPVLSAKNPDLTTDGRIIIKGETEEEDVEYNFRDDVMYGLSYYFGMCLSIIREQDPKEFLRVLNNIMTTRKEITLEEAINKSGIPYDDFISGEFVRPKVEEKYLKLTKRFNV